MWSGIQSQLALERPVQRIVPGRVPRARIYSRMRSSILLPLVAAPAFAFAQARSVDWPVYGGNSDHTHYSTIDQITPANVAKLQVAWTYVTHDEFTGS